MCDAFKKCDLGRACAPECLSPSLDLSSTPLAAPPQTAPIDSPLLQQWSRDRKSPALSKGSFEKPRSGIEFSGLLAQPRDERGRARVADLEFNSSPPNARALCPLKLAIQASKCAELGPPHPEASPGTSGEQHSDGRRASTGRGGRAQRGR